jgi:hypothetical protein
MFPAPANWCLSQTGLVPIIRCRVERAHLTAGVFAATSDFHNVRFLGFFAVFAAVLATRFGLAVASRMRAFRFALFLCHDVSLSKWTGGSPRDVCLKSC